eukprot:scaffold77555_cov53-Phaeocystis_antarctica.AAC.4
MRGTHISARTRAQVRAGRCWGGVRAKHHVDLHTPASTGRGPRGQGPGHRCGQRHRRVCPEVRQPDRLRVCGLKYDACSSTRGLLSLTYAGSMLVKCSAGMVWNISVACLRMPCVLKRAVT